MSDIPEDGRDPLVKALCELHENLLARSEERLAVVDSSDLWAWAELVLIAAGTIDRHSRDTAAEGTAKATHRHKKRGTEYVLIGYGRMQAGNWYAGEAKPDMTMANVAPVDMAKVAIYRSATDPTEIWVRPREEFEDGRFEPLAAYTGKEE